MIKLTRVISPGMRRPARRVTVPMLALLAAGAITVAAPAVGARAATTTTLRDVSTLFCLDSNGNGNVYTLPCNGGNYQNWVFQPVAGYTNAYNVVDAQTQRCLDSNASGDVYTLPCNGGNYQNWLMSPTGTSPSTFKDVSTLFCLDSNTSEKVYTDSCNGGNFQEWQHS